LSEPSPRLDPTIEACQGGGVEGINILRGGAVTQFVEKAALDRCQYGVEARLDDRSATRLVGGRDWGGLGVIDPNQ